MNYKLTNLVNSAQALHEEGIVPEAVLIDLKDIQLDRVQEQVVELEHLVRTLAFSLWNHQDCSHNEDIVEALGNVPSRYIDFY